jgi:hypothetical protein
MVANALELTAACLIGLAALWTVSAQDSRQGGAADLGRSGCGWIRRPPGAAGPFVTVGAGLPGIRHGLGGGGPSGRGEM